MTQQELERQLSETTGETLYEIRRHGFSLTDTTEFDLDTELCDMPHLVDWAPIEKRRNVSVVVTVYLTGRAA